MALRQFARQFCFIQICWAADGGTIVVLAWIATEHRSATSLN
jgi:hypothetical protein